MMNKIEIDFDNLPWWAKPLLFGILATTQDSETLKRYAELTEIQDSSKHTLKSD